MKKMKRFIVCCNGRFVTVSVANATKAIFAGAKMLGVKPAKVSAKQI